VIVILEHQMFCYKAVRISFFPFSHRYYMLGR
jgi:hypothetical protein